MTLEEQFAKVAEQTEFRREESIRMATVFIYLINEQLGPGRNYYAEADCNDDEAWTIDQQNVWRYLYDRIHINYLQLSQLLSAIETGDDVLQLMTHCLWMSGIAVQCEDDEDVNELLDKTSECDLCHATVWIYMAHWLLHDTPLSYDAVAVLVHEGFDNDLLVTLKGLALKEASRFTGIQCG